MKESFDLKRLEFWRTFSFLAILVLLVFGFYNYFLGHKLLFYLEVGLGLVLLFSLLTYRFHQKLDLAIEILLLVVMLALLIMFFTGGMGEKTGIYWYFVFPVATFFLFDRLRAVAHILLLVVLTVVCLYFSQVGVFEVAYSVLETRQMLASLFVVAFLVDRYKKQIDDFQLELQRKNQELARNVEERDGQYYRNEQSLLELKQNKVAMLNLLEDARSLELQLKAEKESVELKVVERTKQLDQEKKRLFSFLSSIPEGVLVIDRQGVPFFANKSAEKLMGINLEDFGGRKLSEAIKSYKLGTNALYPIDERPSTLALLGKLTTVSDIEIDRDGVRVPLRVTGAPVYGIDGKVEYGIVVFDDITEEVVLNRSKEEFFSIASHELRTPLTAIRGNSSMIREMYVDKIKDRDFEDMITDIYDGSVRLIGLVNDFLDMGRLEQGKIEFKKENVSIFDLVTEIVEDFQSLVSEKGGKVLLINSCGKEVVLADKDRLRMVVTNLVGNALKFTSAGRIVISTKSDNGKLVVTVKDSGSGVPVGNQSLLFRKFQQAGSSLYTRDTSKGTGLGLYVSRLMIEGMGGKIWLEKSAAGVGSEFCFSLNMADQNSENNATT